MTPFDPVAEHEEALNDGFSDSEYAAELMDNSFDSETELVDKTFDHAQYETELLDFSYDNVYNDEGKVLEGPPVVEDEKFTKEDGSIDWNTYAKNADSDGFDTREPIENVTLQTNETFARYGSERGHYGTDPGTSYDKLSLPNQQDTVEYHEYRVISPVECQKGTVAPNFERSGGGTQYLFSESVARMEKEGKIVEVRNE